MWRILWCFLLWIVSIPKLPQNSFFIPVTGLFLKSFFLQLCLASILVSGQFFSFLWLHLSHLCNHTGHNCEEFSGGFFLQNWLISPVTCRRLSLRVDTEELMLWNKIVSHCKISLQLLMPKKTIFFHNYWSHPVTTFCTRLSSGCFYRLVNKQGRQRNPKTMHLCQELTGRQYP